MGVSACVVNFRSIVFVGVSHSSRHGGISVTLASSCIAGSFGRSVLSADTSGFPMIACQRDKLG
jgi:hypothetical protein